MDDDDTALLPKVPEERDGLAAELGRAAPRRWWNRGTLVLGAVALALGGFLGGLQAQKHWGTAETGGAGGRSAAGFPGGGGGQNRGGYFGGGGQANGGGQASGAESGGTTGRVKLVDGTTIYVETEDGDLVTVKTDGKTTVSTASKGKLADVKAGQTVTVRGSAAEDGTVTATTVTATEK